MAHFGYKLPNCGGVLCPPEWASPRTIEELATDAARAGFRSLWLHDHVLTPDELKHLREPEFYEPVTVAVRLLALLPEVQIGIATIVLPLRDPVVLAKQLVTAARFFPGRLIAGIGSGRYASEFAAFGSPLYDARSKVTDEHLRLMRALLTSPTVTFSGTYRSVVDAQMFPKARPGELALWLAANAPVGIKRAARHADGWIAASMPLDEFRAAHETYTAAQRAASRSGAAIALSLTIDPDGPNAREDGLHRHAFALRGSASEIAAEISRYEGAGATHFLVTFPSATLAEVREKIRWFSSQVVPGLLAAPA